MSSDRSAFSLVAPSPTKRPRFTYEDESSFTWVFRGCVVRTPRLGALELDEHATVVVDTTTGVVRRYFPSARRRDALVAPPPGLVPGCVHGQGCEHGCECHGV